MCEQLAGYSRLTGLDEEGTLKRLRRRELINPAVSLHRGRAVKTTGDGILIEIPLWMQSGVPWMSSVGWMDGTRICRPAADRISGR